MAGLRALKLRLRRRQFLARAIRRRRQLSPVSDRTAAVRPGDVLCFLCVRNEFARLPHFLRHHRALGVRHFLVVDNASTDGTAQLLQGEPDVSLWQTSASYKASRFGMDWLGWLQLRHGHGHWCLTLDADELLIYPYLADPPLPALTDWMDAQDLPMLWRDDAGSLPKGAAWRAKLCAGQDPTDSFAMVRCGAVSPPSTARDAQSLGARRCAGNGFSLRISRRNHRL